jgi:hypothetical protein
MGWTNFSFLSLAIFSPPAVFFSPHLLIVFAPFSCSEPYQRSSQRSTRILGDWKISWDSPFNNRNLLSTFVAEERYRQYRD